MESLAHLNLQCNDLKHGLGKRARHHRIFYERIQIFLKNSNGAVIIPGVPAEKSRRDGRRHLSSGALTLRLLRIVLLAVVVVLAIVARGMGLLK